MNKIDHSISNLKSTVDKRIDDIMSTIDAKNKQQKEFRWAIMGFISLYIDGSSKRSYDDSLIGRSYMMIKFNT